MHYIWSESLSLYTQHHSECQSFRPVCWSNFNGLWVCVCVCACITSGLRSCLVHTASIWVPKWHSEWCSEPIINNFVAVISLACVCVCASLHLIREPALYTLHQSECQKWCSEPIINNFGNILHHIFVSRKFKSLLCNLFRPFLISLYFENSNVVKPLMATSVDFDV